MAGQNMATAHTIEERSLLRLLLVKAVNPRAACFIEATIGKQNLPIALRTPLPTPGNQYLLS